MLVHYCFVRRDLPLGVMAAQLTHAAGESAARYQDPEDGRFKHAIAVVLEAKNEDALHKVQRKLWVHNIQYVTIEENEGPYKGQMTAIGIVPAERSKFGDILAGYQTLKTLDNVTPAP